MVQRIILVGCAVALTCFLCLLFWRAAVCLDSVTRTSQAVEVLAQELPGQVLEAVDGAVAREADRTRELVDRQVGGLRTDLRDLGGQALSAVDARLASMEGKLDGQLTALNGTVQSEISKVADPGAVLLENYSRLPAQFEDRFDYFLNCENNGFCWQGLVTDYLVSGRYAAKEMALALPKVTENVNTITKESAGVAADVHKFTTEFTKPQPWWKKIIRTAGDSLWLGRAVFGF